MLRPLSRSVSPLNCCPLSRPPNPYCDGSSTMAAPQARGSLVQGEFNFSTIGVGSFETAASVAIGRFTSPAIIAPSIVECCIVENGVDERQPGCARRVVLRGQAHPLRDTLVALHTSPFEAFATSQLTAEYLRTTQPPSLRRRAFADSEAHHDDEEEAPSRDPLSIRSITDDPFKYLAQLTVTFDVLSDSDKDAAMLFLTDVWGRPLLRSLVHYILDVVVLPSAPIPQLPPKYDVFEDAVVAATAKQSDPRLEELLDAYAVVFGDAAKAKAEVRVLHSELLSRELQLQAATRQLASVSAENRALELRCLLHGTPTVVASETQTDQEGSLTTAAAADPSHREQPVAVGPTVAASTVDAGTDAGRPPGPSNLFLPQVLTPEALDKEFRRLDVHNHGRLSVEELAGFLRERDTCAQLDGKPVISARDVHYSKAATLWIREHTRSKSFVSRDEFSVLMCHINAA